MNILGYLMTLSDGKLYNVTLRGCDPISILSQEDKQIIYNKIEKIRSSRHIWGTCSIQGKPVTIRVEEENKDVCNCSTKR